MSSSHVDSDGDEPPTKKQRCTKRKDYAWNVKHVTDLVGKACRCDSASGKCLQTFSGKTSQVAELRMKLKALPPGEADLTVVNMFYGSSQLDLQNGESDGDRVSNSSQSCNDSPNVVASDGHVESADASDRVDDSDQGHIKSGSDESAPKSGKATCKKRRVRKQRYEHKLLGLNVCRDAMQRLLGCRHPGGVGKRRVTRRWFHG